MGIEDTKPHKKNKKGDCAKYCKNADTCVGSAVGNLCVEYSAKK